MVQETLIPLLADGLMIVLILLATFLLLFYVNAPRFAAYSRILLAGLTAYVVAKLVGAIFQPETVRPFEKLGVEAGASFLNNPGFPSDHMLLATAIVYAVWFETKRVSWTIVCATLAFLIGLGRVLALVHTPTDVIGAVIIATVGIVWYLQRSPEKAQAVKKKNR